MPDTFSTQPRLTTKQKKLFSCVKRGDVSAVEDLLKLAIEVNFATPYRSGYVAMTPLMVAAYLGNDQIVRMLIRAGSRVDQCIGNSGHTALYYAVRSDNRAGALGVVNLLLDSGANPNMPITDGTGFLFSESVRKNAASVVRRMLDGGATVNPPQDAASSPLSQAASIKDTEIVRELTGRGANVNWQSLEGWTALMHASKAGAPDIVEILLSKGSNVNAKTLKGHTALLIATDELGNCLNVRRWQPLPSSRHTARRGGCRTECESPQRVDRP